jgi:hypothetical protein
MPVHDVKGLRERTCECALTKCDRYGTDFLIDEASPARKPVNCSLLQRGNDLHLPNNFCALATDIYQFIPTVPGQQYSLSFYAAADLCLAQSATFEVAINAQVLAFSIVAVRWASANTEADPTQNQALGATRFLPLSDRIGMVERELFASTYRSHGLATARLEPFENGRGFSLRIFTNREPRETNVPQSIGCCFGQHGRQPPGIILRSHRPLRTVPPRPTPATLVCGGTYKRCFRPHNPTRYNGLIRCAKARQRARRQHLKPEPSRPAEG